jgi:hypothetical protein
MLGNGHNVGARNFQNLDFVVNGSVQVDVVRANSSSDAEFEVLGLSKINSCIKAALSAHLLDEFLCEIPRMERGSDQDLGL